LEAQMKQVDALRTRWSDRKFSRIDRRADIADENTRRIYESVAACDAFPTWIDAVQLNEKAEELGPPLDPPARNYMEDYMIRADGTLLMRTRQRAELPTRPDSDGVQRPTGVVIPGSIIAQYEYRGGKWEPR
jgi:hypothetical protein